MQAIICKGYGSADQLELQEVAQPNVGPKDVLIKIRATTVSAGDVHMRRCSREEIPLWPLPLLMLGIRKPRKPILGIEIAGEVAAVGAEVTRFQPGQAVYGATGMQFGGYAEYAVMPETGALAPKPEALSFAEAAAIPVGAGSALYFLEQASLKAGERVLIYGASGSVGTYSVQIAKHLGAHVTAVCSSSRVKLMRELGADAVIDYTREDFKTQGATYDIIFDTVGKTTFKQCKPLLKSGGRYAAAMVSFKMVLQKLGLLFGSNKQIIVGVAPDSAAQMQRLTALVEAGHIRPIIDRDYPLAAVPEAHRYVEQGHKLGNVVINVS